MRLCLVCSVYPIVHAYVGAWKTCIGEPMWCDLLDRGRHNLGARGDDADGMLVITRIDDAYVEVQYEEVKSPRSKE